MKPAKNLFKRLLTAAICLMLTVTAAGCNKKNPTVDNNTVNETELQIMILNRGYGMEWARQLEKLFEQKYPGTNVVINEAIEKTTIETSLRSGKSKNDIDLYFDVSEIQSASLVNTYASIDGGIYELTNLYNTVIPGEGVTYGNKMNAYVRNELAIDGKYYSAPWAESILGIFYNETVLNEKLGVGNWSVPATTDELIALGDQFKEKSPNKFLLYAGPLDLIGRTLFLPWWAQYEGAEAYEQFWQGVYNDPEDGLLGNTSKIYEQKGRLKALETIEVLCRADNGYAIKNVAEIGLNNYKQYQTRFFSKDHGYAIYPCGDWLEQESAAGGNCEVKMMRTPVLSSIIEKCPTIENDAELSALIKAIDTDSTALSGTGYEVSQSDYDRIYEARHIATSMSNFHIGYIPQYANAKGLAEKFLLLMASDEGIATYKNYVSGGFIPFEYDYSGVEMKSLEKSVAEVTEDAHYVYYSLKNPLFYKGGIFSYTMVSTNMDVALNVSKSSKQYMTATDIYEWYIDYYNETDGRWEQALSKLK